MYILINAYLWPIFVYRYFDYVPLFLENGSIFLHLIFYRCFLYYSDNHLFKKTAQLAVLCWEPFWVILGAYFGICCSIFESCSVLSHKGLYKCFFVLLQ